MPNDDATMGVESWRGAIDAIFAATPVMPVVQIERADDALPLAQSLLAGGISAIEVTLRTEPALEAISIIVRECPDMAVGAGTIVRPDQLDGAADAGAQFIVSPGLVTPLVDRAKARGVPLLPAAVTGSEITLAINLGLSRLKFFPAEAAGGRPVLKALGGPFPDIRFCPTGGIGPENLPLYLGLANVMGVGGSWITEPSILAERDWVTVERRAADALSIVRSI